MREYTFFSSFYLQKQLGEGLALEAEKALYTLLGYNTDKIIRFKFIEACLENLANHTFVLFILSLLFNTHLQFLTNHFILLIFLDLLLYRYVYCLNCFLLFKCEESICIKYT